MNKKFSTLVACLLLATSVGTVSAQTFQGTLPAFDNGGANVKEIVGTQYYQLSGYTDISASGAATGGLLAMTGTPGDYKLEYVAASTTNLNNTLWTITSRDNGFGTLLFTFTNKATGEVLAINTADATKENDSNNATLAAEAIKVGGTLSEWRWYNFNKEADKKFDGTALIEASFANGDSTVALGFSGTDVVAVKAKNNENYQASFAAANQLKVTPYTANSVKLSAYDLNTRLQSLTEVKNFNLKFTPDAQNNQWENWLSKQALIAEGIDGTNFEVVTDPTNDKTETWVRLHDAATDSKKYVYLDTAYVADKNIQYADLKLRFAFAEPKALTDPSATAEKAMKMRGAFAFTLFPSNDSLAVAVANVEKKADGSTDFWRTYTYTQTTAATSANFVKLAYLTDGTGGTKVHSEVTVGAPETGNTLRTKITLTEEAKTARVKTTLQSGLYFIRLNTADVKRSALNGAYWKANITGNQLRYANEESSQALGSIQNFGHMPEAQWVVEQSAYGVNGQQTVTIINREFPDQKIANVQLYKAGDGSVQAVYATGNIITAADTLTFKEVKDVKPEVKAAYTDTYFGYLTIDSTVLAERIFNLDYLSGIKMGNYVNVLDSKSDSIIYVDVKGEKVTLVLETVPAKAEGFYGYQGTLTTGTNKLFQPTRRTAYNIKVKDGNKLIANSKYVVSVDGDKNATGKPVYAISDVKKEDAAMFFLKENNTVVTEDGKDICYYALIDASATALTSGNWNTADSLYTFTAATNRAGIKDGSLVMSSEKNSEERIAAFALTEDNSPLYRRLGVSDPEDGLADMTTDTAKIYRINATSREYLYEDAYSAYSKEKGINFLGVEGKGDSKAASLFIDTAYVRNETNMPQYMFAVGVTVVPEGLMCPENPEHNTPEYIANHGDCGHKVQTKGYVYGRYLINAQDSVASAPNGKDYIWNEKYTRLAFVPAKHIEDTLVIYRNGKPSLASEDSIFLGNNAHNKVTDERPNGIKNPVFALRLINDEPQCDFLIESAGNHKIPTDNTGKWIAIKNGVPVVASYNTYKDAILDAEHFNIEKTAETPTANEGISTSEVSVVAGNGKIIIKGAQGKTVAISNVLGQTIANTVLSSDNAEIAAPAGVVVVAVEGEAAVKAIVK